MMEWTSLVSNLVLGLQIDRTGRTYLEALTATGAGLFVDEQHLRGIMRDRLVDCLALGQPLVELILDLDGTDVDACSHLVADGRVDAAGLFQEVDLVIPPSAYRPR